MWGGVGGHASRPPQQAHIFRTLLLSCYHPVPPNSKSYMKTCSVSYLTNCVWCGSRRHSHTTNCITLVLYLSLLTCAMNLVSSWSREVQISFCSLSSSQEPAIWRCGVQWMWSLSWQVHLRHLHSLQVHPFLWNWTRGLEQVSISVVRVHVVSYPGPAQLSVTSGTVRQERA